MWTWLKYLAYGVCPESLLPNLVPKREPPYFTEADKEQKHMQENGISYTEAEIEQERQDELVRLKDRIDKPIDEIESCYMSDLGTHEALHAAYMMTDMVSQFLLEHPVVVMDPIAWKHAHDAHTALFNLYQRAGNIQHGVLEKIEQTDRS